MIYESYERNLAIVIIMIEVDSKNWRGQEIGSDLFVYMLRRLILVSRPLFWPLIMLLSSFGKMYVPLFVKILECGSDKKRNNPFIFKSRQCILAYLIMSCISSPKHKIPTI